MPATTSNVKPVLASSAVTFALLGQRFPISKPADTEKLSPPIHVVTGWFEELKRRVPMRP